MLANDRPRIIHIYRREWEQMKQDVARRSPEEACGLLAGHRVGDQLQASAVFITTNLFRSDTRYRIDPAEQLAAFNQIDALGLELVGIYHSHPNGPDEPSPTDIAEAYYPEAAYLIWCNRGGKVWTCAAYVILEATVYPLSIQVIEAQA